MRSSTLIQTILGPAKQIDPGAHELTLRYATPADAEAIDSLAQLDSRRAPRGLVLLAEVDGAPWGAVSLDDGQVVADPFRPTGELVALLTERARQVGRSERGRMHVLPRVWPAAG
jgi:hypothetical protein